MLSWAVLVNQSKAHIFMHLKIQHQLVAQLLTEVVFLVSIRPFALTLSVSDGHKHNQSQSLSSPYLLFTSLTLILFSPKCPQSFLLFPLQTSHPIALHFSQHLQAYNSYPSLASHRYCRQNLIGYGTGCRPVNGWRVQLEISVRDRRLRRLRQKRWASIRRHFPEHCRQRFLSSKICTGVMLLRQGMHMSLLSVQFDNYDLSAISNWKKQQLHLNTTKKKRRVMFLGFPLFSPFVNNLVVFMNDGTENEKRHGPSKRYSLVERTL